MTESITPLHRAAETGDAAEAERLLAGGADPCAVDGNGDSPLSLAIRGKHAAVIRLLVDHGALAANRRVSCPFLVHLPETGDLELFSYVLSKGRGLVGIEDRDPDGRAAFHYAVRQGHEKILQLILRAGFDMNPAFLESVKRGDYHWVKGSIDHSCGLIDVNAADALGNTALHYAAFRGDSRMAKLLLDSGADGKLRNKEGKTPAMLAPGGKSRQS